MRVVEGLRTHGQTSHKVNLEIENGPEIETDSIRPVSFQVNGVMLTYHGSSGGGWDLVGARAIGRHEDEHSITRNKCRIYRSGIPGRMPGPRGPLPKWMQVLADAFAPGTESPLQGKLPVPPDMPWFGEPVRLDTVGCTCHPCRNGESVPIDRADKATILKAINGELPVNLSRPLNLTITSRKTRIAQMGRLVSVVTVTRVIASYRSFPGKYEWTLEPGDIKSPRDGVVECQWVME